MDLRLDSCVLMGELDNRQKGWVTGRIWLNGYAEPVELRLQGNAEQDLAGQQFEFRCDGAYAGPQELSLQQQGFLGELTAAEKGRVPECRGTELVMDFRTRTPYLWRNTLFLRLAWWSEQQGLVTLKAPLTEFRLVDSADWVLAEAEAAAQQEQWLQRSQADAEELELILYDHPEEDEGRPQEEVQADAEDARMNLIQDRVESRLAGLEEVDWEAYDEIYQEEKEKLRKERGEPEIPPPTPEQREEQQRRIEELNAALEQAEEEWDGVPPEIEEHPLAERLSDLSAKVSDDLRDSGWVSPEHPEEHPFREVGFGLQIAAAKLAGGLNILDGEWPPDEYTRGPLLVRLKKARGFLRDTLRGLDGADQENLGLMEWRAALRLEVEELHEDLLDLIETVRSHCSR